MKTISVLFGKADNRYRNMGITLMILLCIAVAFTSWLFSRTNPVMAETPFQAAVDLRIEPSPTLVPADTKGRSTPTSPVVGILVLLAPLVLIAWKSRGKKEPKSTASCCAPVIDENKRPFKIHDEQ